MLSFKALACDYDGTLASKDHIDAEVLASLEQAREAGLRLILVTGRTFFELIRVCERLDLFDAVVAENGGVLYFPAEGTIKDLAPAPPHELLVELDRHGIAFHAGRVIVGTARAMEKQVHAVLAAVGASAEFSYNRDALMLLPMGISKGSGVRQVIRRFGLSFHDVLALGDAENDLDLFEACGWAGCPGNAVPEVKERADWVFEGANGKAIARAILGPILGGRLPSPQSRRHRIPLGWTVKTSEPVTMAARGFNLVIQGDPLSGKSWLAGGLVERLLSRHYALCVFDPEGDFHVLTRLAGVAWIELRDDTSLEHVLGQFVMNPAACVVIDFSLLPHAKKVELAASGLRLIRQLRRRVSVPHWVFLDEAHYLLHRAGVGDEDIGIEERGFCLITYRPSWLRESIRTAIDVVVAARTTFDEELAFFRSFLVESFGGDPGVASVLPGLPPGEFLLVQGESTGEPRPLTFAPIPRETPHVRHRRKYADVLLPPEQRFCFRRPDGNIVAVAGSLHEFLQVLAAADDRMLAHHARGNDFSRWITGVYNDQDVGRQIQKFERRWIQGEIPDLREPMAHLLAYQYGSGPTLQEF